MDDADGLEGTLPLAVADRGPASNGRDGRILVSELFYGLKLAESRALVTSSATALSLKATGRPVR